MQHVYWLLVVLCIDFKYHFLIWPWSDSFTLTSFYIFSSWPWILYLHFLSFLCIKPCCYVCSDISYLPIENQQLRCNGLCQFLTLVLYSKVYQQHFYTILLLQCCTASLSTTFIQYFTTPVLYTGVSTLFYYSSIVHWVYQHYFTTPVLYTECTNPYTLFYCCSTVHEVHRQP